MLTLQPMAVMVVCLFWMDLEIILSIPDLQDINKVLVQSWHGHIQLRFLVIITYLVLEGVQRWEQHVQYVSIQTIGRVLHMVPVHKIMIV
jgi:hypothetical protein